MSRFDNLVDWLDWLEQSHPTSIELGLERVFTVADNLGLIFPNLQSNLSGRLKLSSPIEETPTVVTIAGTNGKGSCVSTIEQALLLNSSHKNPCVGSYTSPHFHHYCERIKVDGLPVAESLVCEAFAAIDAARVSISLTYFEFGTLAALWIFQQLNVPVILLEVGLGGRLDAVNIIDTDIAVVTSIDLDHQDWLGDNRESISQEKLGISRKGKPLIIADPDLTTSMKKASLQKQSLLVGRDFHYELVNSTHWQFTFGDTEYVLPIPSLPLPSVTSALVALKLLGNNLSSEQDYIRLMNGLDLTGRFEKTQHKGVEVIYDVAHNPAACKALAKRLSASATKGGKTFGVFAAMQDKDLRSIVANLRESITTWCLGNLPNNDRAASTELVDEIIASIPSDHGSSTEQYKSVEQAFEFALTQASKKDRIIVFGSFFTVAAIQSHLATQH